MSEHEPNTSEDNESQPEPQATEPTPATDPGSVAPTPATDTQPPAADPKSDHETPSHNID